VLRQYNELSTQKDIGPTAMSIEMREKIQNAASAGAAVVGAGAAVTGAMSASGVALGVAAGAGAVMIAANVANTVMGHSEHPPIPTTVRNREPVAAGR
jgi:hypothetical protein